MSYHSGHAKMVCVVWLAMLLFTLKAFVHKSVRKWSVIKIVFTWHEIIIFCTLQIDQFKLFLQSYCNKIRGGRWRWQWFRLVIQTNDNNILKIITVDKLNMQCLRLSKSLLKIFVNENALHLHLMDVSVILKKHKHTGIKDLHEHRPIILWDQYRWLWIHLL